MLRIPSSSCLPWELGLRDSCTAAAELLNILMVQSSVFVSIAQHLGTYLYYSHLWVIPENFFRGKMYCLHMNTFLKGHCQHETCSVSEELKVVADPMHDPTFSSPIFVVYNCIFRFLFLVSLFSSTQTGEIYFTVQGKL